MMPAMLKMLGVEEKDLQAAVVAFQEIQQLRPLLEKMIEQQGVIIDRLKAIEKSTEERRDGSG